MRVSTITSRFRACTAVATIAYILSHGLNFDVAWSGCKHKHVLKNMLIMTSGQEIDQKDLYTPYSSDFGLCNRSSFSTTSNPTTHSCAQAACALKRSYRSQHAILMSRNNFVNANASIMAFAMKKTPATTKAIHRKSPVDTALLEDRQRGKKKAVKEEYPKNRSGVEWLLRMKGFIMPDRMKIVKKRWNLRSQQKF